MPGPTEDITRTRKLLKRAAGGEQDAFARIVSRYEDLIRRVSYLLLHDSAAAEDVTQETFLKALDRIDSFRGDGEPRSWFYSIALNLCRRRLRDGKRNALSGGTSVLERGKKVNFRPRGILTSLMGRETRRRLAIALGFLTDKQKEAFVLHYVEELPYETVGEFVGATAGAARALAHRARQILREKLSDLNL